MQPFFCVVQMNIYQSVLILRNLPCLENVLVARLLMYVTLQVEFHPGIKSNLKENLPLSMMKIYNEISHFSQLLKSEASYVKNIRQLKARCIKRLRLNA